MSDRKKARTEKKQKKTLWNSYRWAIVGGVLALVVLVIIILVYGLNSLGLTGVSFSEKSGFYKNDLSIKIEPEGLLLMDKPAIKYNMNGDDLFNSGDWYDRAIKLEVPEEGYRLYTITAFACRTGNDCTEQKTATYVLGKKLENDATIDIININSSQKNLYDYDTGIMVGGRTYDLNSTLGSIPFIMGNYNNRGKNWRREARITRFGINGEIVWDEEGLIEISGGTSASYDVKSMKIIMRHEKDCENCLETFRLRSGSQDQFSGNIRSSVVSRLVEESGFDCGVDTKRVVVFLNGEYYGIFDMQQNTSEYNMGKKYSIVDQKRIKKLKGPEDSVFDNFGLPKTIWDNLDSKEGINELEELVDMDDYLKYFAVQILINNTDWPMNNFEAWRYEGNDKTGNKYEDGRLRFLIYDTDLIYYTNGNINWFEGAIGDILSFLLENKYRGSGSSFNKVMDSEYYRQRFISLIRELLNGPFKTENVLRIIDEEAGKIEHQVNLFSTGEGYKDWVEQIELLKEAASEREDRVKADIKKYFGVKL